ncbi:hypothetical protein [Bacillus cereus]|uniref:hypothetical protein n=1 Tax=Bacillus cereus TaxID=1396 RepID=UPI000BECCE15|nr:hypothetical protein [Bacillus cereus]PEA03841.1 hypothetical protein CON37_15080 [Bacillus cereus]
MSDIQDDVSNSHALAIEEIKLYSAVEALEREARRIEVPENTELLLTPTDRELSSFFSRVQIKSYTDMQILGLIPQGLAEEKVRHAIITDDQEAYKIATTTMPYWTTRNCECEGGGTDSTRSFGKNIRLTYNDIRKDHNLALANLLSDHYGTHVAWDSSIVSMISRWQKFIGWEILVLLAEDIIINANATLKVDSRNRNMVLLAHDIWFHETSQLVQQCRYLKIWANSINSFYNIIPVGRIERKITPPWLMFKERR